MFQKCQNHAKKPFYIIFIIFRSFYIFLYYFYIIYTKDGVHDICAVGFLTRVHGVHLPFNLFSSTLVPPPRALQRGKRSQTLSASQVLNKIQLRPPIPPSVINHSPIYVISLTTTLIDLFLLSSINCVSLIILYLKSFFLSFPFGPLSFG